MRKPKTNPYLGAILLDMAHEARAISEETRRVTHQYIDSTNARLARVLYLHECLGGTRDTFARVTGLTEEQISTIAEAARELKLHE